MNRSPEPPKGRPHETELEDRVRIADSAPADPELAADWALRQELRALASTEEDSSELPPELRRAVMAVAERDSPRRSSRWPGLPVAMAAGLAGLIALAVVLRPIEPEPVSIAAGPTTATGSPSAEELKLALATIDRTSRRALSVAGREVGETLVEEFPRFEIERLPYSRLLTSFRLAPPRSYQPEED